MFPLSLSIFISLLALVNKATAHLHRRQSTTTQNYCFQGQNCSLQSNACKVVPQDDSNLLIYPIDASVQGAPIWQTGRKDTSALPPYQLMLQTNGNLELKNGQNQVTWKSNTATDSGTGPFRLSFSDTCDMNVYNANNETVWSSAFESLFLGYAAVHFDFTQSKTFLAKDRSKFNAIPGSLTLDLLPATVSKSEGSQFKKFYDDLVVKTNDFIKSRAITELNAIISHIQESKSWWLLDLEKEEFVLCSPQNMEKNRCMRTEDHINGHKLYITTNVDLDGDLIYTSFIEDQNGELKPASNTKHCFAYLEDNGNSQTGVVVLRNFDDGAAECTNGAKFKFKTKKAGSDGLWKLVDYEANNPDRTSDMCKSESTEYISKCTNGGELNFNKFSVPYSKKGDRISFPSVGVIVQNFPTIASIHLVALKQKYFITRMEADSQDVKDSVEEYKNQLDKLTSILNGYKTYKATTDFDTALDNMSNFKAILDSVSVEFVMDNFPPLADPNSSSSSSSSSSTSSSSSSDSSSSSTSTSSSDSSSSTSSSTSTSSSSTSTSSPSPSDRVLFDNSNSPSIISPNGFKFIF